MTPAAALPAAAPRLEGVRKILRFNWPLYAWGLLACAAGATAAGLPGLPAVARAIGTVAAIAAGYLLVASLVVSWWVYDRSGLRGWTWATAGLPAPMGPPAASPPSPAGCWALCHAGFDEAGAALAGLLGPPLDTGILVFTAHEVRRREQRAALFIELARVLRSGGAVLVEHPRDLANVIAFGPGAWHFYPRREWLVLARDAGFELAAEVRHTPFVRGFVLCRR